MTNIERMKTADGLRASAAGLRRLGQTAQAAALEAQAIQMMRPGVAIAQAGASLESQAAGIPTGSVAAALAAAAALEAGEEEEEEEAEDSMTHPNDNWRRRAPIRVRPFGQTRGPKGVQLILGALPKDSDDPWLSIDGDLGLAELHDDRVELFLPFALPAILEGGKALLGGLAAAAGPSVVRALGGTPAGEEEESEEEEDSQKCDNRCHARGHGHLAIEPIENKRPNRPGIYYDREDGHVELFLPLIMGAVSALAGPLMSLFGRKKKPKQPQQQLGPAGPGEPAAVQAAVAAAAPPPAPAPAQEEEEAEEEDSETLVYDQGG